MKAAFCTNAFGNTQNDIKRAIPQLAQMGYDGLEFWEQYLKDADLGWLKGIMDAHHLEIVQICPYFDFTTSSETWERSIQDAERYIGYALQLGGPFIRNIRIKLVTRSVQDCIPTRSMGTRKRESPRYNSFRCSTSECDFPTLCAENPRQPWFFS